jgi:hypothetical protein
MQDLLLNIPFENFPSIIKDHLEVLKPIDHFTLAVNLFILIFSKWFATRYSGKIKDTKNSQARLRILHVTNFILFVTYLIAVVFEISFRPSHQSNLPCHSGKLFTHSFCRGFHS